MTDTEGFHQDILDRLGALLLLYFYQIAATINHWWQCHLDFISKGIVLKRFLENQQICSYYTISAQHTSVTYIVFVFLSCLFYFL